MSSRSFSKYFAVLAAPLLVGEAGAHALVVDVDPITPGIQTSASYTPGSMFTADIHLISDGATPITGFGLATEFNDIPGVLAPTGPTTAGPVVGAFALPLDLVTPGPPLAPGAPLLPAGLAPFGIGPGGPFTGTDSGAGIFDLGPGIAPAIPAGGTIVLQSVPFLVTGAPGTFSDIAPLGILLPMAPPAAFPPPIVPLVPGGPGMDFYDSAGSSYPAAPVPASPFLGAVNPGTIFVVPEPSSSLLVGLAGLAVFGRRRS